MKVDVLKTLHLSIHGNLIRFFANFLFSSENGPRNAASKKSEKRTDGRTGWSDSLNSWLFEAWMIEASEIPRLKVGNIFCV
jgi:hypothetical protein